MPLAPSEDPDNLAATLKCLVGQSLQADELIIAADGPLPRSLLAVIEGSVLPIRLHNQHKNKGIGETLAVVGPQCQGDVILRIDSDDLYSPEHTAMMVAAIQKDPQLGVVGCQLLEMDTERCGEWSARTTPTGTHQVERWLPWRNPLNHQTVAIRRDALVKTGGYRHCLGFEDWDLWLRMRGYGFLISNLSSCTAAARVNSSHLGRRRGWSYVWREFRFYRRMINEGHIGALVGATAWISRIPWRVLPKPVLGWWMRSDLRGLPTLDTTWVTKLLEETPGEAIWRE